MQHWFQVIVIDNLPSLELFKRKNSECKIDSKAGGLDLLGFRDEGRIILPLLERTRGKVISFTGSMTLGCVEVASLTLILWLESDILSCLSVGAEGAAAGLASDGVVSSTSGCEGCMLKGFWTAELCAATDTEGFWDDLSKKLDGKRGIVSVLVWELSACRRAALDWRRLEKKGVNFKVFSFSFSSSKKSINRFWISFSGFPKKVVTKTYHLFGYRSRRRATKATFSLSSTNPSSVRALSDKPAVSEGVFSFVLVDILRFQPKYRFHFVPVVTRSGNTETKCCTFTIVKVRTLYRLLYSYCGHASGKQEFSWAKSFHGYLFSFWSKKSQFSIKWHWPLKAGEDGGAWGYSGGWSAVCQTVLAAQSASASPPTCGSPAGSEVWGSHIYFCVKGAT